MNPVRVVCDTNVLVSALLGSSVNRGIVEIFKTGQITLLFSKETLAELTEVLGRPHLKIPPSEIRSLFRVVRKRALMIRSVEVLYRCRDSKDEMILAVAHSGKASYLVTRDKDILSLSTISKFRILTPAKFVESF